MLGSMRSILGAKYWADGGGFGSITFGLVGWWKFDENTGSTVADSSGRGHDGIINGTPTWVSPLVGTGYALQLDGTNNYINVPHHADFSFGTGDFSLSIWAKHIELVTSTLDGDTLISKDYRDYEMSVYQNKIQFRTETGGIGTGTEIGSLANDVLYHYFAKRESGVMSTWINGVLDNTLSLTDNIRFTYNITIGGRTGKLLRTNSIIDDVRIYNRALSAAEIQAIAAGNG
jgi:hypothetical protein